MKSWSRIVAIFFVAAGVVISTSCDPPTLTVDSPVSQTLVTSPVAAQFSWSLDNKLQGPPTITLDGQDVSAQFVEHDGNIAAAVDASLPLANGAHQLSISATLFDNTAQQFVATSASSSFTVADPLFTMSFQPTAVTVNQGGTASATLSIVRTPGYTENVGPWLRYVPFGLSVTGFENGISGNSVTLSFSADPNLAMGTYTVLLSATGATSPTDTLFFQVTVGAPPTWTQLYNTYFAPSPASTPGHCNNCHRGGVPATHFFPGPTQDTFYQELVNRGLVTPSNPAASPLGDPALSPLRWVNPNGPMPFDMPVPNDAAKSAITAWLRAGAINDAAAAPPPTCVSTGNPCGDACSGTATDNCGTVFTCDASCDLDGLCPCRGGVCRSGVCACDTGSCF